MFGMKILASVGAISAALAFAAPASAVVTTFATFSPIGLTDNIRYVNSGNAAQRATDAVIYSTPTSTSTAPGSALVRFSFLQSAFVTEPAVQNVTAKFTLNATVAKNSPAQTFVFGGVTYFDQPGISGSFSFITTSAITLTAPNFVTHTYAAGSTLLAGTFAGADLTGSIGGTTGAAAASTMAGDTITFHSDFLDLTPTFERELDLSLTSVIPAFATGTGANKSLKTFRGVAGGQFSSDPEPLINGLAGGVPEPSTWALMIGGFGLAGSALRRRRSMVAA